MFGKGREVKYGELGFAPQFNVAPYAGGSVVELLYVIDRNCGAAKDFSECSTAALVSTNKKHSWVSDQKLTAPTDWLWAIKRVADKYCIDRSVSMSLVTQAWDRRLHSWVQITLHTHEPIQKPERFLSAVAEEFN